MGPTNENENNELLKNSEADGNREHSFDYENGSELKEKVTEVADEESHMHVGSTKSTATRKPFGMIDNLESVSNVQHGSSLQLMKKARTEVEELKMKKIGGSSKAKYGENSNVQFAFLENADEVELIEKLPEVLQNNSGTVVRCSELFGNESNASEKPVKELLSKLESNKIRTDKGLLLKMESGTPCIGEDELTNKTAKEKQAVSIAGTKDDYSQQLSVEDVGLEKQTVFIAGTKDDYSQQLPDENEDVGLEKQVVFIADDYSQRLLVEHENVGLEKQAVCITCTKDDYSQQLSVENKDVGLEKQAVCIVGTKDDYSQQLPVENEDVGLEKQAVCIAGTKDDYSQQLPVENEDIGLDIQAVCIAGTTNVYSQQSLEDVKLEEVIRGNRAEADTKSETKGTISTEKELQTEDSVKLNDDKTTLKLPSVENNKSAKPDYYDDEQDDLTDEGWDRMRTISTDEEWYKEVKHMWSSNTAPNPHKNLTCHSYRKRNLVNMPVRTIRQVKRSNTSSVSNQPKRSRSCTYNLDEKISAIREEYHWKQDEFASQMQQRIQESEMMYNRSRESVLYSLSPYVWNNYPASYYDSTMSRLRSHHERTVREITDEYRYFTSQYQEKCALEINRLNGVKDEVLHFNEFYGNCSAKESGDFLTGEQLKEVEEIESIFNQFNKHYGEDH